MGQLRSAVRAVAGPEAGPGRLLSRLDRFVEQVQAASMATLAYAELDLATGELRYACAGHPPPLLIPAEGKPRLLWQGRSTPLGAFTRPQLRAEARVRLDEGDRVLLYTDGLIERRDRALDVGLDLLSEAASVGGDRPLDEVVQEITRRLLRDEVTRDDVCVLLLSWHGSLFERHVGADLRHAVCHPARARELARWSRGGPHHAAGHRPGGLGGAGERRRARRREETRTRWSTCAPASTGSPTAAPTWWSPCTTVAGGGPPTRPASEVADYASSRPWWMTCS